MPPIRSVFILEYEPLIAAMLEELVEELGAEVVGPACSLDRASFSRLKRSTTRSSTSISRVRRPTRSPRT